MTYSYLRGRLSNDLTDAIHPAQLVEFIARSIRCRFSSKMSSSTPPHPPPIPIPQWLPPPLLPLHLPPRLARRDACMVLGIVKFIVRWHTSSGMGMEAKMIRLELVYILWRLRGFQHRRLKTVAQILLQTDRRA